MTVNTSTLTGTLILDPGGSNLSKTVTFMKIYQAEQQHDMAIATVRGEDASLPEFKTGTPCLIKYGWMPNQIETFYGYINHTSPPYHRVVNMAPSSVFMDVVCLSASFVLKDAFTQWWSNVQASSVVAAVATNNMFSSLVENDDPVWPRIANPGNSAWTFLVGQARRLGWLLACNKTNLRFLSSDRAIFQGSPSMATFWSRDAAPNINYETINTFTVLQGETLQEPGHTRANRVLSGLDLSTGNTFTINNDGSSVDAASLGAQSTAPFFVQYERQMVSSNQIQGHDQLEFETQRNRFHIQARARVSGDTTVVQGVPVSLNGLGPVNSGVWYVQEVIHELRVGSYVMDLYLGRDSSGDSGKRRTNALGVAWSPRDLSTAQTSRVPATVLINGQWRATWQGSQVVPV